MSILGHDPENSRRVAVAEPYSDVIATQRPVRSSGAAAWLGVPMIARHRVIGVLSVQSEARKRFSADDVVLLSTVASQAAAAIDHGALLRDLDAQVRQRTADLEQRAEQLAKMNRVTQSITSMHDLDTMLQTIAAEMVQVFDAYSVSITLLDEARTAFRIVANHTVHPDGINLVGISIPVAVEAAAMILRTRKPIVVP
jgi:GAF domain-containing protein